MAIQFFLAAAMMVSYVFIFLLLLLLSREGKNFKFNVAAL